MYLSMIGLILSACSGERSRSRRSGGIIISLSNSGPGGGLISLSGTRISIEAPPMTIPASRMTMPKKAIRQQCSFCT
jgi:hypothetical protein